MTVNPQFDEVAKVNRAFGHAIRNEPGLDYPDVDRRFDFFIEEVAEMAQALALFKVALRTGDAARQEQAKLEFLDGAIDTLVTLYGVCQATGMPITEGLSAVTKANLSKLDSGGNPIYEVPGDSNTKVIKGPNYVAPTNDLKELLSK